MNIYRNLACTIAALDALDEHIVDQYMLQRSMSILTDRCYSIIRLYEFRKYPLKLIGIHHILVRAPVAVIAKPSPDCMSKAKVR